MNRRRFVALVGGAAACPLAARAQQQTGKIRRIGYLSSGTASGAPGLLEAFRQRLRELGWIEGQNIVIDYRFAEGQSDRLPGLADELVRLKVDLIATATTPPALAAKNATKTIPIVGISFDNPVQHGLIASLAHPEAMSQDYPTVSAQKFSAKTWSCSGNFSQISDTLPCFRTQLVQTTPP